MKSIDRAQKIVDSIGLGVVDRDQLKAVIVQEIKEAKSEAWRDAWRDNCALLQLGDDIINTGDVAYITITRSGRSTVYFTDKYPLPTLTLNVVLTEKLLKHLHVTEPKLPEEEW